MDQQKVQTVLRATCRVIGASFLVFTINSAALAQDWGSFSAGCLANDSVLKSREGLASLDAGATVMISPASLWPPDKKFRTMKIAMSLPAGVDSLSNPINVSLTLTKMINDQVVDADADSQGCGPATVRHLSDWAATSAPQLTANGRLQNPTDAVSITGVQLRGERCANIGKRTYEIRLTCCDITNSVCDTKPAVVKVTVPKEMPSRVHHYEYVFPDGNIYVYDIDHQFDLVKHFSVPTGAGVRGSVASAATGTLYLSYGSDASAGSGSMLAYDLMHDSVLWVRHYPFGIDSMSIANDGKKIYMPTGELSAGGVWQILDGATGDVIGSIDSGGLGPHNTVVSLDSSRVYLGPRASDYLVAVDTASNTVEKQIGPVLRGVRPFTINGTQTLAFLTTSGFLGFQVGSTRSGQILYTAQVKGFGGVASAPSHGISLSPDEREIYLIDSINSYVHVFDVSGLPQLPPRQIADIPLLGPLVGDEYGCAYDCLKDGWLHHSRDGRYVFVGDSGDVIDTKLRKTIATLPAMANSRKEIEIDFLEGARWSMNNRSSLGRRR